MSHSDCNLEQLSSEEFKSFLLQGYVQVKDFLKGYSYEKIVKPLIKKLTMLEMEGKLDVRRPINATTPLNRTDKFFNYNLTQLEGVEELKDLKQLSRYLFFLPFEINKKIPLNL